MEGKKVWLGGGGREGRMERRMEGRMEGRRKETQTFPFLVTIL